MNWGPGTLGIRTLLPHTAWEFQPINFFIHKWSLMVNDPSCSKNVGDRQVRGMTDSMSLGSPPCPLASFCIFVSHQSPGHTAELEASWVQIYTHFSSHWTSETEGLINSLIYCSSGIWVQVKILSSGFGSETEECDDCFRGRVCWGKRQELGIELPWRAQGGKFPSGRGQRKKEIVWKMGDVKQECTGHKKVLGKKILPIKTKLEADQLNI